MPANETKMLITLSHCVVVRTFFVLGGGSADGGSADGVPATVGGTGAGFS